MIAKIQAIFNPYIYIYIYIYIYPKVEFGNKNNHKNFQPQQLMPKIARFVYTHIKHNTYISMI